VKLGGKIHTVQSKEPRKGPYARTLTLIDAKDIVSENVSVQDVTLMTD
jgi:uridylate kinase